MSSIGKITEDIINRSPFIREAISTNLINISAFARKIKAEVISKLGQEVNEGAIIMAIKRLDISQGIDYPTINNSISHIDDFIVRNNLVNYSIKNIDNAKFNEVIAFIKHEKNNFYTYTKGISTISITSNQQTHEQFSNILTNNELKFESIGNLASITLKSDYTQPENFGIHYTISKELTLEGIHIQELITSTQEFTLIINQAQLDKTLSVLLQLKKGA